jgi:NAD(P)H-hydrate epimerase
MKIKYVTTLEMRRIDSLAVKTFGIPSLILMENAGIAVANEAEKMLENKPALVLILCGYGNNGGDGFVAARHLVNRGYRVIILLVGHKKEMSEETEINFVIARRMKININKITNEKQIGLLSKNAKNSQLIIDAIFGIGIKGRLDRFYCQLIEKINTAEATVLSIDIPSGLDADSGEALPIAIKAKKTVTMGLPKKSFLSPKARKYLGRVVVADISLPKQLK